MIETLGDVVELFPDFTPALDRRLGAELAALDVSVHPGATAEGLREILRPTSGPLASDEGMVIVVVALLSCADSTPEPSGSRWATPPP